MISKIDELSIIFPIYNEEVRLKKNLKEIIRFLKKSKKKIEIIFVDDGSQDASGKILKNFISEIKLKNKSFKYLRLNKNYGKGYALKMGVKKSNYSWILTSDIDLSVPLNQIIIWEKLYNLASKKIVFGSRNLKGSKVKKNFIRFILGWFFNNIISIVLNISIADTQCGFKLYKKSPAKKIFSNLSINGFTHDLELVILAKKSKINIIELPVTWTHKNGSKLNIFYDPLKMFLNIILLKVKFFKS